MADFAHFLEKLQSADEGTKMKWIIIATSVIMIVVIYIWLMYFNNLLSAASAPIVENTPTEKSAPVSNQGISIMDRVGSIYHAFIDKIGSLGNILTTPKDYIIKPN